MKNLLTNNIFRLALLAGLALPAAAADVSTYLAVKGLNLLQTNAAAPVVLTNESPYQFVAEVLATETNSVTNATVKLPSNLVLPLANVAGAEQPADFVAASNFISKALLDAKFPGGTYTFAIRTLNTSSNSAALRLPADAYPPAPHIANWDDAQAIESDLPMVLRWDAISNGTASDLVLLDIEETNGATVLSTPGFFQPGALNGTNVAALIPAGDLAPDHVYAAQLLVIKSAVRNTNAVAGVTGVGGYFRQTKFPLVTLPEPVAGGRVQFSASAYTAGETDGAAVVTVTCVGERILPITVHLATSDGTAAAGTNYLGVNTTLKFYPDMSTTNVVVPILNDFKLTGNLTVNLALSGLTGNANLGGRSNAVLTIVDSQRAGAGTLQFSPTSNGVAEATATVNVTVKRTGGSTGAVGVQFHTLDGTAVAGTDYVATNGTLNFAANSTSQTIPIHIINNTLNETNASFYVALGATTGGAALGTNLFAKIVITDNDPGGVVSLASTGYTTNEGGGFFFVTVNRTGTGTLASNASVDFATADGTAQAGLDYVATNGTLTFGTNQSSRTIAIPILTNTNADGYGNFTFQISNPHFGATLGTNRLATLTIQHDTPCIAISNATYSVSEAGTNVAINLVRFGPLTTAAAVDFATVNGTAVSPTDYRGTNGTAQFPVNTRAVKITIPIVDNTIVQSNRTFNFVITTNAQGGVPLGSLTNATVTIVDNDLPGTIQFAATSFSALEGSNAAVKIVRTGGLASGVTVQFIMSGGTAVAGIDYSNKTQTVTFSAGQTNQVILVPLITDPLNVTVRTVNLTLTNATAGATLGVNTNAILNILNNPNAGAVPLNGPLFIAGTISGVAFAAPTSYCTLSSSQNSAFQLNAIWDTGTVSAPIQNQLMMTVFPRVLGKTTFNNSSPYDSGGYQWIPLTNPNLGRYWSAGGSNRLTPGATGTFILDAIDYTQKLASGRFTLHLGETTGGVAGAYKDVTGSFRVALIP